MSDDLASLPKIRKIYVGCIVEVRCSVSFSADISKNDKFHFSLEFNKIKGKCDYTLRVSKLHGQAEKLLDFGGNRKPNVTGFPL